MLRRTLLKGLAASAVLPACPWLDLAARAATLPSLRRVRPGDPAWPNAASWQSLKDSVGGNLLPVQAPFAICAADMEAAACQDAVGNIKNPFYLGDQAGGTQVSGWLDAWMPQPSVYAVRARHAADMAAAITFARRNNLRLVVKGTGHSYLGTSNAPDSLLLWTRGMNDVTLHDAFVPAGSKLAPVPAVTAGAGCVWIDLYHAVTTVAGRYVQGGGCTDVGVAGLVQGGGFGSLSKGFGTAAASLLEAEVVTADGAIRTVNHAQEPDLFWALKGGGGGTFAAVTKLTLRTHDLPRWFGFVSGTIKAANDDAFRRLLARFVAFYARDLFNPHWGEQAKIGADNTLALSMLCQGLEQDAPQKIWQPFFDWVRGSSDYTIAEPLRARGFEARHMWNIAGNPAMIPDKRPGAPGWHGWWEGDQGQVGAFLHGYDSLWLSQSLLRAAAQPKLVEALFAASRFKEVQLHFNKGIAGASADAMSTTRDTATNPQVCEAFVLVIIADGEGPVYPGLGRTFDQAAAHKDADAIAHASAALRKIAPDAGSYVAESNYFIANWKDAYWGDNYARLRAIKDRYDPDGLFFAHHGVGSEDWSADGFVRMVGGKG
ncbi:MAG TPA: FAD-binding oxidoreductase [Rhizomicrobium sp.]